MNFLNLFKRRQTGKYAVSLSSLTKITPQSLKNMFNWRSWTPEKQKHFRMNIIWGLVTVFLLHLASYTGIGQQMLNETYDYLVKKDFQRAVLQGREDEPISDVIRLIAFDKETYETSFNKGFWTPRDVLGKTILKSIELGAKVVIVDIAPDKAAPFYLENLMFLSCLRQAADQAEETGSVILVPWTPKIHDDEYTREYESLLKEKQNIIIQGSSAISFNPSDLKVRHFSLYQFLFTCPSCKKSIPADSQFCPVCHYPAFSPDSAAYETYQKAKNSPGDVMLSLPVLAAVYQWHGREKGSQIIAEVRAKLKKDNFKKIFIPSDTDKGGIRIYPENPFKECLSCRYKFRIVSGETIIQSFGVKQAQGRDLLNTPVMNKQGKPALPRMLTPAMVLNTNLNTKDKIYQDKTVLIGSTYEPVGDTHFTPVGDMPGVFLVANGLNVFLKNNQIHEHPLLKILAAAVLILLAALLFCHLPIVLAAFFLTLILLILNTPVSIWLFMKWGLLFDFWLMVIGISILENIVGAAELITDYTVRRHKLRFWKTVFSRFALLKSDSKSSDYDGETEYLKRRKEAQQ